MSRRCLSLFALLSLGAYALPLASGVMAGVGHAAGHLYDVVQEQHRTAVALGLTHAGPDTPLPGSTRSAGPMIAVVQDAPNGPWVHEHDGSVHAHGGTVHALLSAADDGDELSAGPTGAGVSTHVPVGSPPRAPLELRAVTPILPVSDGSPVTAPAPPLRPPRA